MLANPSATTVIQDIEVEILTRVSTMIELVCSVKGPRKAVRKCMAAAPRKTSATSRKVRGRAMPTIVVGEGGKGERERSGLYGGPTMGESRS